MWLFWEKNIYDSKVNLNPIFVKKKSKKIWFLREVMGKIAFSSPTSVNECWQVTVTFCQHIFIILHNIPPCFGTQFRRDQTTQQYFCAVSTDLIDQQAICIVFCPVYYHSYPAAWISTNITSVSLESVVIAWFPPLRVRLGILFLVVLSWLP